LGNAPTSFPRTIFVGWTGMQSQRRLAPVVGSDGISGSRGSSIGREQDISLVEIDSKFARLAGLVEGQKVCRMITTVA
jgi:peroxin-1